MKRTLAFILVMLIMFSSIAVCASDEVTVTLNGVPIQFDVPAQIINDRTMVPMRKIFESFGANVDWVAEEQGIVAVMGSKIIAMKIGSNMMYMADVATGNQQSFTLDVPPCIVGDRTLVPVRAISEGLGIKVDWNGETRTVILTK